MIHAKLASQVMQMLLDGEEEYNATFQLGDVDGRVNDIDGAVGFILYVKRGYLTMLEGYTNIIDEWPETDSKIRLKYDAGKRDYIALRTKWTKKR